MDPLSLLPDGLVDEHVLAYLPLEDLLLCRGVSRHLRTIVDGSRRWLPVIAPPSIAAEAAENGDNRLSIKNHSRFLFQLYVRYQQWLRRWQQNKANRDKEALRCYTTALGGFFALAPWERLSSEQELAADGQCLAVREWPQLDWL